MALDEPPSPEAGDFVAGALLPVADWLFHKRAPRLVIIQHSGLPQLLGDLNAHLLVQFADRGDQHLLCHGGSELAHQRVSLRKLAQARAPFLPLADSQDEPQPVV